VTITRREFLVGAGAAAAGALGGCAATVAAGKAVAPAAAGAAPGTDGRGPMKLLVLGGTAFLGPALVEAARARGHAVTLFNRGKTNPGLFPDLETLHGDRDGQLDALRGRRWDAVLDTSGYVPRVVRQSAELLAPAVERYLFVSSISVYADGLAPPITEGSPLATAPDPATEDVRAHYGALKALCERAVEAAMPGRALSVRPGLIAGPGDPTDRFTYWPVRLARGGEVLAPGDGLDPVQFVDVRDLAAFAIRAVEQRLAGTLNATGPAAPLLTRDFLEACRAPGVDARLTWVEEKFLEEQHVSPWSDLPVWVPRSEAFTQVSCAPAIAAGLAFRPAAETARDTLAWWRGLPEERRAKPRTGLTAAREAEVLAAWKAVARKG
jgi:2'-hydroxyisoflavone reductase